MLTAVIAACLVIQEKPVYMCPTMNNRPTSKRMAVDYGSTRYYLCCDQCVRGAVSTGVKALEENARKRDILIADVIFDPVSNLRVNEYKVKVMARDGHKMWLFESAENMAKFTQSETKAKGEPQKECLTCPVCEKTFKTTGEAYAYQDINGARYYVDSKDCLANLFAQPSTTARVASKVGPLKTRPVPVPGIDW